VCARPWRRSCVGLAGWPLRLAVDGLLERQLLEAAGDLVLVVGEGALLVGGAEVVDALGVQQAANGRVLDEVAVQ
jgi:hypothetical protein